jgi:hypothetical protein
MRNTFLSVLILLSLSSSTVLAGDDKEKQKIKGVIEDILKAKDIDALKKMVKDGAQVYSHDKAYDMIELIKEDEKQRALGKGSYEELLSIEIKIDDDFAYALAFTKITAMTTKEGFFSSSSVEVNATRANTIILEKDKSWKVVHWHMSQGAVNEK